MFDYCYSFRHQTLHLAAATICISMSYHHICDSLIIYVEFDWNGAACLYKWWLCWLYIAVSEMLFLLIMDVDKCTTQVILSLLSTPAHQTPTHVSGHAASITVADILHWWLLFGLSLTLHGPSCFDVGQVNRTRIYQSSLFLRVLIFNFLWHKL